jgi:hypothetical protein
MLCQPRLDHGPDGENHDGGRRPESYVETSFKPAI